MSSITTRISFCYLLLRKVFFIAYSNRLIGLSALRFRAVEVGRINNLGGGLPGSYRQS